MSWGLAGGGPRRINQQAWLVVAVAFLLPWGGLGLDYAFAGRRCSGSMSAFTSGAAAFPAKAATASSRWCRREAARPRSTRTSST